MDGCRDARVAGVWEERGEAVVATRQGGGVAMVAGVETGGCGVGVGCVAAAGQCSAGLHACALMWVGGTA
eukprot:360474-Chlamydomonas_euryale.AAC.3